MRKQVVVDQTSSTTIMTNSGASHLSSCNEDAKVEVFLGGSCNPTTWRADVAIPELQKLGISFYNPVRIL
jgi:Nucleoside 2-deoxyribosyltransferase like